MKTLSQDPYKENIADESPLDLRGVILEHEQDVNQGKVPNRTLKQSKTLARMKEHLYNLNPGIYAFDEGEFLKKITQQSDKPYRAGGGSRQSYDLGVNVDYPKDIYSEDKTSINKSDRSGLGIMPYQANGNKAQIDLANRPIERQDNLPPLESPYASREDLFPLSEAKIEPEEGTDSFVNVRPGTGLRYTPDKQPQAEPSSQIPTGAGVDSSQPFDRNFLTLLGRSAAQIGTLGGKAASAEPLADYIKSLEDKDRSMIGIAQKEKGLDQPISAQEAELTNAMLKKYGVDVDVTGMKRGELEKSPTLKAILDLIKYQEKPDIRVVQGAEGPMAARIDKGTGKVYSVDVEQTGTGQPPAPGEVVAPPPGKPAGLTFAKDESDKIAEALGLPKDSSTWTDAQMASFSAAVRSKYRSRPKVAEDVIKFVNEGRKFAREEEGKGKRQKEQIKERQISKVVDWVTKDSKYIDLAQTFKSIDEDIKILERKANKTPSGIWGQGEIAGYGPWERGIPDALVSKEEQQLRADLTRLANTYIYDSSGKAINENEMRRLKAAIGTNFGISSTVLRKELQNYIQSVQQKMKMHMDAIGSEARDELKKRGFSIPSLPGQISSFDTTEGGDAIDKQLERLRKAGGE